MLGAPENVRLNVFQIILIFVVGWLGHVLYLNTANTSLQVRSVRENSEGYQFTNPFLYNDNSNIIFHNLDALKDKFLDTIERSTNSAQISDVSVYFRKLSQGEWTGVNVDHKYLPVSLLKVADLIVYLRKSEHDPLALRKKLHYSPQDNRGLNYPPINELVEGDYEVSQLIRQDIIESDNAAHIALSTPIEVEIEDLYKTLRFPEIPSRASDWVTPVDISTLFRTLYGATYLNNDNSEYALKLLSQTSFSAGLVAGVGTDVKVSHKFGEFTMYYLDPDRSPDYQLHDCGIIYYPNDPYFICVMTKGSDLAILENVIRSLSAVAYNYVSQNN